MAKRHLLLILCIILSIPSLGVETMIQGNAFYYRNKKIQIHQYQDLFTFKSVSLIEQQIGDDGNFKLILDIEKTRPLPCQNWQGKLTSVYRARRPV